MTISSETATRSPETEATTATITKTTWNKATATRTATQRKDGKETRANDSTTGTTSVVIMINNQSVYERTSIE